MNTKKTAQIGMFVAVAFVLGYVESLLPISFGIPGIKLGLSNIVVLLCLYEGTVKEAFGIAIVRIVLSGFTFGSLSMMMYGRAGGMLSFLGMLLLKKSNRFSIYGVSVAGGVSHNIGQILVAMFVLQTGMIMYYLPFLLAAGSVAGICIGFVGGILAKRLHGMF